MERIKTLLKSKAVFYILLALFCIFLGCLSKEYDFDLYARLIVGEHFFSTGWISYEDFLSYTPRHLWYDHEWGASVIFYAFFKVFGPFGLILIHSLTMFLTTVFIIKTQQLQKHAYPTSLFFIAIFLLLYAHQNPSIVRCHMFSFMFFAMFLYFLEKTKKDPKTNILWLVPPIVIIWNNIHGGVVSGLGIIFIYMLSAIITKQPWLKHFFVLTVSTPLLAINPYGIEYLNFLISANTKKREYITEWWNVFTQRHVIYYYPLFGTAVFVILWTLIKSIQERKLNISKALVLLVTATLGIWHVKLLSLVLIVIASLYYTDIMKLFTKSSIRFLEKTSYGLISLAFISIPFLQPNLPRTNWEKYPVLECEFLKINNIKGNILTSFGLGSYTSYKLYNQNLIYMDGRYEEVYYDREFENLIKYEKADSPDWDDALLLYPTEILMPEKTTPVYTKLQEKDSNWIKIYEGNVCGIFVKKGLVKKEYKQPVNDLNYYKIREFETIGKFGE